MTRQERRSEAVLGIVPSIAPRSCLEGILGGKMGVIRVGMGIGVRGGLSVWEAIVCGGSTGGVEVHCARGRAVRNRYRKMMIVTMISEAKGKSRDNASRSRHGAVGTAVLLGRLCLHPRPPIPSGTSSSSTSLDDIAWCWTTGNCQMQVMAGSPHCDITHPTWSV
ncbi:hypothetical protein BJX96DRAFT_144599 [Aspergillus floccosus]